MNGWCYWCDNYSRALTMMIVNATQEEKPICEHCSEKYGDDGTGEVNAIFGNERKGDEG